MNEQPSDLMVHVEEQGNLGCVVLYEQEPAAIREAQRVEDAGVLGSVFVAFCCFLLLVGVVIGSWLR